MVLEKTLESALDCKEIQPVHPKGDQPWIFIGRTDVEAEAPIIWRPEAKNWLPGKDRDAGKDWGQEEKRVAEMRWWDSNTDSMDMNLSKLQARARDRETFSVVVHGVAKSQTWLNDWTTTIYTVQKKNQGLPTLYKLEDKLTLRIMNMVSDKLG